MKYKVELFLPEGTYIHRYRITDDHLEEYLFPELDQEALRGPFVIPDISREIPDIEKRRMGVK